MSKRNFVLLPTHITSLRSFFEAMQDMANEAGLSTDMLTAVEIMLDNPPANGSYIYDGTCWVSASTITESAQPDTSQVSAEDELEALKAKLAKSK